MRLSKKKAVIVGGASEMANTANKMFLSEGASIFLIDFNETALDAVTKELSEYKDQIFTFAADVRSYEQMETAMNQAEKVMGRIDILVNCAGIIKHSSIDEMNPEDWQSVINVNLTGYFNSCKSVTPIMKKQEYGRIVNISSIGGRTGRPGCGCNYAASKAGIVGLTQTLAKELAPCKITANVIAPGPLKGRMFYSMEPERQRRLEADIPLGYLGDMEQVAYAMIFLASDESAYITGEVLDVNGGLYI